MLIHIYAGTAGDWIDRNWSAIRKREPGSPFTFFCWDNEGTLDTLYLNNTGLGPDAPNTPAYLFWKLEANAEYRMLLADRVQRHFFTGGVFYVDPNNPAWDPTDPNEPTCSAIRDTKCGDRTRRRRRISPSRATGLCQTCLSIETITG